jgi:NitT/TauT family transport system ATP-binding protein
MASSEIVVCENLCRSFYSKEFGTKDVLRNINFRMSSEDFVVIIGPSGCGKSTLLNIIAGFVAPTLGQVMVHGSRVEEPGPERAMVFQDYALLPWLNARENVEIGLRIQKVPRAERRARALRVLDLVGLGASAELPVYKMSGGMQQRVSIARALALEPVVLLMDEPFGAVDAFQRAIMQRELTRIWKATNASIIFVTHSLEEAIFLGNRVLAMTPGGVGIAGELTIDLPRPRDPMSMEFAALKRKIFSMLTAHLDGPPSTFVE